MLQTVSGQILLDKVKELKFKLEDKWGKFILKDSNKKELLSTRDFEEIERYVDLILSNKKDWVLKIVWKTIKDGKWISLQKKISMRGEVVELMNKLHFAVNQVNYDYFVKYYDYFVKSNYTKTKKWWGDYHFELTKKEINWV